MAVNPSQAVSFRGLRLTCDSPEAFEATLAEARAANDGKSKVVVLATGKKGPDGVSWCPDCTRADPVLEAKLGTIDPDALVFVECPLDAAARPAWKACVPCPCCRPSCALAPEGAPSLTRRTMLLAASYQGCRARRQSPSS